MVVLVAMISFTSCEVEFRAWYDGEVCANHSFDNPTNALTNLRNLPYVEGAENASTDILNPVMNLAIMDNNGNWVVTPRVHYANEDFCKLVNLRLLSGRYPEREGEIAINTALVEKMGWTSNGIGEVIFDRGTVTGIVEYIEVDTKKPGPYWLYWQNDTEKTNSVHLKLKEPFDENLLRLNEDMKKLYPQDEILFIPVEESLRNYFRSTRIFRNSVLIACISILIITLIGVIGYTNEEVRRRSKEIAIRKVNGAEINNILLMLCRDVTTIAIPSVVIGVLLSCQVGEMWVSTNFRDILSISPLLYIGVAIVAMVFIIGTVIVKSWRIANENPVLSIKSE